ncbi:MAG: DEAD/DEAH box helicase [Gammaproteobacteria bacterium]
MQTFKELGVEANILQALSELGYETPSPIQEQSIPVLLNGKDLLAQAQTGTGKTAAFAIPVLTRINIELKQPQAIILAPTRELAIQVAESFQSYAKHIPGFHVLPIYGGQDYRPQLRALERGVHVVVGTPGRVMDHLRRGSLSMQHLKMVVLDEADEMLNMGFLEDVKWILQQIPGEHQTALFSATIPPSIRAISDKYLKDATHIHINSKQTTVDAIEQFYMVVSRAQKVEALTRFLEVEDVDGMIIFTRTKTATLEVAEKLEARGYAVAAINGDLKQDARERVIKRIKNGQLDIVVATDIAARGLDVERLSHVVNFDIPYDTESYVHRIGRTGRAGRIGKALLLVEPREGRMLKDIERTLKQQLKAITPPSIAQLHEKRIAMFTSQINATIANQELDTYRDLIEGIAHSNETSILDIAAALAYLAQKDKLTQPVNKGYDMLTESLESGSNSGKKGRGGERSYRSRDDRRPAKASDGERRPRRASGDGERRPFKPAGEGDSRPRRASGDGERRPFKSTGEGDSRPRRTSGDGERRPFKSAGEGDSRPRRTSGDGERRPFKPAGEGEYRSRKPSGDRSFSKTGDERKPYKAKRAADGQSTRSSKPKHTKAAPKRTGKPTKAKR